MVGTGVSAKVRFSVGSGVVGARDGSVVVGAGVVGASVEGASVGTSVGKVVSGVSVAGGSVVGASVAGASVAGASVVGASVAGASVSGASVAGASVAGASVAGASVAGASVAGASVAGGSVVGGSVAGGSVAGGSVAGGSVGGAGVGGAGVGGAGVGGAGVGGAGVGGAGVGGAGVGGAGVGGAGVGGAGVGGAGVGGAGVGGAGVGGAGVGGAGVGGAGVGGAGVGGAGVGGAGVGGAGVGGAGVGASVVGAGVSGTNVSGGLPLLFASSAALHAESGRQRRGCGSRPGGGPGGNTTLVAPVQAVSLQVSAHVGESSQSYFALSQLLSPVQRMLQVAAFWHSIFAFRQALVSRQIVSQMSVVSHFVWIPEQELGTVHVARTEDGDNCDPLTTIPKQALSKEQSTLHLCVLVQTAVMLAHEFESVHVKWHASGGHVATVPKHAWSPSHIMSSTAFGPGDAAVSMRRDEHECSEEQRILVTPFVADMMSMPHAFAEPRQSILALPSPVGPVNTIPYPQAGFGPSHVKAHLFTSPQFKAIFVQALEPVQVVWIPAATGVALPSTRMNPHESASHLTLQLPLPQDTVVYLPMPELPAQP